MALAMSLLGFLVLYLSCNIGDHHGAAPPIPPLARTSVRGAARGSVPLPAGPYFVNYIATLVAILLRKVGSVGRCTELVEAVSESLAGLQDIAGEGLKQFLR